MSRLSAMLQEPCQRDTRTILALLNEQMDGVNRIRFRTPTRSRSLKERLGLRSMGCCGTTWNFRSSNTINVSDSEEEDQHEEHNMGQVRPGGGGTPDRDGLDRSLIAGSMNLAAERQNRTTEGSNNGVGTPLRVSLMKLLAEPDGSDGDVGNDMMYCVCMGRKKGAAFISCGHTFGRVCLRELWLCRGSCPLCNRPILEILDFF